MESTCWDTDTKTEAQPGEVVSSDASGIAVATGEGLFVMEEIQLEGKTYVRKDFLRGQEIPVGNHVITASMKGEDYVRILWILLGSNLCFGCHWAIICLLASARVKEHLTKYNKVRSASGMTGRQAAERMLQMCRHL